MKVPTIFVQLCDFFCVKCVAPDKMDRRPCKIMWDVPWEHVMTFELAKAGYPIPSHLIIHLNTFRRGESFVRVIKCNTEQQSDEIEPQATRICSVARKMWKAHKKQVLDWVTSYYLVVQLMYIVSQNFSCFHTLRVMLK